MIFIDLCFKMGASLSLNTKYTLGLDFSVISKNEVRKDEEEREEKRAASESESDATGSGSEGSDSESESSNSSVSDDEGNVLKMTPQLDALVKSYIKSRNFNQLIDEVTEIDLSDEGHRPGTSIVFEVQSHSYDNSIPRIEVDGIWRYIPGKAVRTPKKRRSHSRHRDQDSNDESDEEQPEYKTAEDDIPLGKVLDIVKENIAVLEEDDWLLHKNRQLYLKVTDVVMS